MQRTIGEADSRQEPVRRKAPAATERDRTGDIIADFRATMTLLKSASSERLRRLGVSMAQLHILFTLQRCGEMTMSQLAEMLNVSLSNATGLIDRLEERGFIERNRVPTDRRVVLVHVTDAGEQMLGEVDALTDELMRSVLGRLSGPQLRGVGQAVSSLRAALESTVGPLPPPHRHGVSTGAPRSTPTIRPADLKPTQHGWDS